MDKKSLLAVLVITIIILLLPTYYELIYDTPPEVYQQPVISEKPAVEPEDSVVTEPAETIPVQAVVATEPDTVISDMAEETVPEESIGFSSPLVTARFSNRGGGKIIFWILKSYQRGENDLVHIVDQQLNNGPEINFITVNGVFTDLNNYVFERIDQNGNDLNINTDQDITLSFVLSIRNTTIRKKITLYGNRYHIDVAFEIVNSGKLLLNNEYEIGWQNGLPANEQNIVDDYSYSDAYASMGGEIETYSIDSDENAEEKTYNGSIDWIGVRTKYFLTAIIPREANTTGVTFSGNGTKENDVLIKKYNPTLNISYNGTGTDLYEIYMGPLDRSVLKDYESGIDAIIMRHGWYEKTFRAISLPILSLLKFFYMFIPNYGNTNR